MAWELEEEQVSTSPQSKWVLEEDTPNPTIEENRDILRLGKNVGAGVLARTADIGPMLPAIIGQGIARIPAWLTQAYGDWNTRVSQLPQLNQETRESAAKTGEYYSQFGKGMANEVGELTKQVTGLGGLSPATETPFVSASGMANQLAEKAFPELAPRTKSEMATDAATQMLAAGKFGKTIPIPTLGNAAAASGTYMSVMDDNPWWAVAGIAGPTALGYGASKASQAIKQSFPSQSMTKRIEEVGYSPISTPEKTGLAVEEGINAVKEGALPIKKGVEEAATGTYIPISQNLVDDVTNSVNLAQTNPAVAKQFTKDIESKIIDDVVTGGKKISFADLQDLKSKYGALTRKTPAFNKQLYGQIHEMEMNAANDVGKAVEMAKFNKTYGAASNIERDFVNWDKPSKTFDALHSKFKSDPAGYIDDIKILPQQTKEQLNSMHMKELGGGNDFNYITWGKNVRKLDPDSLVALAGGDAVKAQKIADIANKAGKLEHYVPFIEKMAGVAGYAAGGGYKALLLQRVFSSKGGVDAMEQLVKQGGGISNPNKAQAVNTIARILQDEESVEQPAPPTPAKIQGTYEKEQEGGGAGNDKLSPDIVHAEGLRLKAYNDHLGNKTVGYGFNMDDTSARKRWAEAGLKTPFQAVKRGRLAITPQEAKQLANYSYKIAANDAKKLYPNFSKLSKNRQQALINMSYQMGLTNLSGFKDANKAIANGRFNAAVRHFAKSRWVRQTPERAKKILTMLWKDVPYDKA